MTPTFIDHLVILVKNIQETEKFYTKFLGNPIELTEEQVAYKIGDTKIFFGLSYSEWKEIYKDASGLNHLAFGVRIESELREFEKILNNADINNSGIQMDKWGSKKFIWFDDPNGYRLEFYCRH
ncbi:MAG: VOC family protein [Minisyncoccota bacterium]